VLVKDARKRRTSQGFQGLRVIGNHKYKYCHLTGIDQVWLAVTEEEHASEAYRNGLGIWEHLPPQHYYQIVEHPEMSLDERMAGVRALWLKIIGTPLPRALWES